MSDHWASAILLAFAPVASYSTMTSDQVDCWNERHGNGFSWEARRQLLEHRSLALAEDPVFHHAPDERQRGMLEGGQLQQQLRRLPLRLRPRRLLRVSHVLRQNVLNPHVLTLPLRLS